MSDEIDIRHGAVVSVDTATLREAAEQVTGICDGLRDAATLARAARALLGEVAATVGAATAPHDAAGRLAADLDEAEDRAARIGIALRRTAVVYEYVDLVAGRDAAPDGAERAIWEGRLAVLLAQHPGVELAAFGEGIGYAMRGPWEIVRQAEFATALLGPALGGPLPVVLALLGGIVRGVGHGVVPASARLDGPPPPVVVAEVGRGTTTPVSSLGQASKRIPGGASIRVERYAMPDGTRQFVVYVAGTRLGTAFDMGSNLQLYGGTRSASYESVRSALQQAGAKPGEVVHEVAHSQGGMVAGRVALEREYDVRTLITFGSPIQADVPASTLSVEVRHVDDLVSALSDGGSARGVGSPGSFVATRVADPDPSLRDLALEAHHLAPYQDTAALLDASADPRMGAVREVFRGLGEATSVQVTQYSATNPEPSSPAPDPGPTARPAPDPP